MRGVRPVSTVDRGDTAVARGIDLASRSKHGNYPIRRDATLDGTAMNEPLTLDTFYAYGHQGRTMFAVRSPAGMVEADLVGRIVSIRGVDHRVLAVSRQIGGAMVVGEPIGIEVAPPTNSLD